MKQKIEQERLLLVGVNLDRENDINIESSMEELKELVKAAGGEPVSEVIQNKHKIDSAYFIGKGKASEISNYCDELDIDTVVFNDELSGAQMRNLEDIIDRRIIDRTALILDIFANRATSKEGKLQVELAQLKYRLPRLVGFGSEMSRITRTGSRIGTRGPGEKKLEIDRRHIESRISEIRRQLRSVESVREIKRKRREDSALPIVALVGYTNAGKSTLLNEIIKRSEDYEESREVFSYDMLFATLDTTLRRATLPNGQSFLITDTVGFVSKLPTHLVAAFKGTLEEVKYSDLLLHVVDASNEDLDIQTKTTMKILKDLEVEEKPMVTVFNKIDKLEGEEVAYNVPGNKIYISATENINIDNLMKMIEEELPQKFFKVNILIPYNESQLSSYIFDNTKVDNYSYEEKGTMITTTLDSIDYHKYNRFVVEIL
ncbi:GTPase HflX [Sporosalibacterium faouarense]|uniref:GTPase HflX n=1 Tax=Sporosalibacterium faouarense TaxID=516123 RepID=UPI00141CD6D1|nr:GTPase HflX [Sporosalibacterium faouarense]MTI49108.1 GTPase HflX [Bacillota bacterium]